MLIVLEGIDGSGKSSQINLLVPALEGLGLTVVRSKDPGGTPLGLAIRRIMYEEIGTKNMAPGVVDLLFLASHIQNWETVVSPALREGKVVVSDRWWYSQFAYSSQRFVHDAIERAYMEAHGDPADLIIFLYGDPEILVERARARQHETHQSAKAWDDVQKLKNIQEQYFDQFSNLETFVPVLIDDKTVEQLHAEILRIVVEFLGR